MRVNPILLTLALTVATGSACGPLPGAHGKHKHLGTPEERGLKQLETPGLVIGEFALAPNAIVDGDTIKVSGLDSSLRLLGLDAEETFKHADERRRFETMTWEQYLKSGRGDSKRPVKLPTPLGEDAKHFAEGFFQGVTTVKLERDHAGEIRDYYNRYLAYVMVNKGGKWVNFNVEVVRAGMSPYFSKYGYSRRFHDDFVQAQEEAKLGKRGIWAPGKHYDDYEERLKWWNTRAEEIAAFEREGEGKPNWVVLTRWDAMKQLEKLEGQEVELLGSVSDIKLGDKGPTTVKLSRRLFQDFTIVFFDKDVFGTSGIEARMGEYVRVRGIVTKYINKKKSREELQIVVNLPGQITVPGQVSHAQN